MRLFDLFFFQAEDGIRDLYVTEFRRVLFRSVSPLRLEQPGGCPSGETCHPRIWRGVKEAGSFTFATGDKVAVKNTVTLRSEERRVGKECRSRWEQYN